MLNLLDKYFRKARHIHRDKRHVHRWTYRSRCMVGKALDNWLCNWNVQQIIIIGSILHHNSCLLPMPTKKFLPTRSFTSNMHLSIVTLETIPKTIMSTIAIMIVEKSVTFLSTIVCQHIRSDCFRNFARDANIFMAAGRDDFRINIRFTRFRYWSVTKGVGLVSTNWMGSFRHYLEVNEPIRWLIIMKCWLIILSHLANTAFLSTQLKTGVATNAVTFFARLPTKILKFVKGFAAREDNFVFAFTKFVSNFNLARWTTFVT